MTRDDPMAPIFSMGNTNGPTGELLEVEAPEHLKALNSLLTVITLILLACAPAILWAVYTWAF